MLTAMELTEEQEPVMKLTHKLYIHDMLVARIKSDGKRVMLETLSGCVVYASLFDLNTSNPLLRTMLWERV